MMATTIAESSDLWNASIADWGTAVGTVGLALLTYLSVRGDRAERRELKAERDAARARADAVEQSQRVAAEVAELRRYADRVHCYLDENPPRVTPITRSRGGGAIAPAWGPCVVIDNRSETPIRSVSASFFDIGADDPDQPSAVNPVGLVIPGSSRHAVELPPSFDQLPDERVRYYVDFTDINDTPWRRQSNEQLIRLPTEVPATSR